MLENSTATPPILGVPHPVPTLQITLLIVTDVLLVAFLNPFASVCTKVGWLTVKVLPLVLDHTNWVYVVPVNWLLNVFQAVSIAEVGATPWVNDWENVTPVNVAGVIVGVGVFVGVIVGVIVFVGVIEGVGVFVVVLVGVNVGVIDGVGVFVGVMVGVIVGVTVGEGVGVGMIYLDENTL